MTALCTDLYPLLLDLDFGRGRRAAHSIIASNLNNNVSLQQADD